jgi:signal transduction histidine kinase
MALLPLRGHEFCLEGSDPPVWLSLSSVPVASENGASAGFRAVASDITAAFAARGEEERRNTLAALGQLAGGIAHEVNNLLHPIINLSRRVADKHVGDKDGKRLLELVVTSGVRAGEIVRQVLRAYSPEGFSGMPVPVSQAVKDAMETIRATLPASCTLDAQIDDVPEPRVRSGEAIQVLSNLANNSLRAMGGSGAISIRLSRHGDQCALVFADNGPGMSEEIRRSALKPFVTGARGGVGLGLSIVQRVVQDWGGRIEIESAPGQGAIFRISIPVPMQQVA